MGDSDDEIVFVKKQKTVHHGSLAESPALLKLVSESDKPVSETITLDADEDEPTPSTSAVKDQNEYLEMDESQAEHTREEILAEFERRRKARSLVLPTDDREVRVLLRNLEEPVCIFGEDSPERRERLRNLLSLMKETERDRVMAGETGGLGEDRGDAPEEQETTWYHEGPQSLRSARLAMLKYSLARAPARLEKLAMIRRSSANLKTVRLQETQKWVKTLSSYCSQFGDSRPVCYCEFSPDSKMLATASWSGLCKLWSVPDCKPLRTYRGHSSHVGSCVFHPLSTISQDPDAVNLATCCRDGAVKLWSLEGDQPLGEIEGHAPYRVSRVRFYPSGQYLATCCYDKSWRLFDLEYSEEVLYQEGHSGPVQDLAFQCDGSLALTGGLDSYGRVWDMRTGKCVMFLEGHLRGILSVAFSSNGFTMATGSQDNTAKVWDLRARRNIYTIPAHKSLLSAVKFSANPSLTRNWLSQKDGVEKVINKRDARGDFLVTASYDSLIKIWSQPGCHPMRSLAGHDNKVLCVDLSPDGQWLASGSFDRTFKLWTPDDYMGGQ